MGPRPGRDREYRGRYFGLPWELVQHRNFNRLTPKAVKLLMQLRARYGGSNNGDLSLPWSEMEHLGWNSKETLYHAIHELIYYGFIIQTRKGKKVGGIHFPSLYGLTWESLDERGKGYTPTRTPSHAWKEEKPDWSQPMRKHKVKT